MSLCLCVQNIPITALAAPPAASFLEAAETDASVHTASAENPAAEASEKDNPGASASEESTPVETVSEEHGEEESESPSAAESGEETELPSETESGLETAAPTEAESEEETASAFETESLKETETEETETLTEEDSENAMSASEPAMEMVVVEDIDGIIQSGSLTPPAQKADPALSGIASVSEEYSFEEIAAYMVPKLLAREESISLSQFKISRDNISALYAGIVNEHPELYFLENSFSYYLSGEYIYSLIPSYDTTTEYDDAAFQTAVEGALSLLDGSMTDYEKALVLHDYLVLNCEYDLNFNKVAYNAYGALVKQTCVCQGYALAYKYLLKKAGIECLMVTSDEMNHAWNMVVIDGSYYQTDVTWDDPVKDRLGRARHVYFLISDGRISDDHSGWTVQKNGNALDVAADNTRFDDAFWSNISSGILFADNAWFYLNGNKLTRREAHSGSTSTLHTISNYWFVWGSSSQFWQGTYSGLALSNGRLFFNTPSAICSISTNGGSPAEEYVPNTSDGYIYGIALQSGTMKYSLKQSPDDADQIYTAELPGSSETPVFAVRFLDKDGKLLKTEGVTKGKSATAPTPPDVAGYAFTGWSGDFSNVQSDMTIQAIYEPIAYTITYELNGGSENPNPVSYTIESETIVLKAPVRESYTFTGWFTDTLLTEEITEIPGGSYGDLTLYAGWKGTAPAPTANLASGSIADKNETVALSCELEGASIYYSLDGTAPDRSGSLYREPIALTESCTLRAIAVKDGYFDSEIAEWSYTVYKNELILSEEALTLAEDESFTLSVLEIPETKNETDITWSSSDTAVADVSDSGIVTARTPGEAVITAEVTDHKGRTVTADCRITVASRLFKVTFLGRDGSVLLQADIAKGSAAEAPTPPAITGYEFEKWDQDFSNIQSDLTVQAVYTTITYTIDYVLNGGSENPNPGEYTIESDTIILKEPFRDGYTFIGWFRDEALTQMITEISRGSCGDFTLYAAWKSIRIPGLQVEWAEEDYGDYFPYTGSAIKPAVRVFDGDTELVLNKDYTLSYKNNTKVFYCEDEENMKKAPAVIIKGKGNYSGTIEKYFSITAVSLDDPSISTDTYLYIAYNKKANYPVPTIMRNGKKLTKGKDFIVSYPEKDPEEPWTYKDPGEYCIFVEGINGYCDWLEVTLVILEPEQHLLSKASVKVSSVPYTGEEVLPELIVKYGKYTLYEGEDYEIIALTDCTEIGTHKIELWGCGDSYSGTKTVSFKITGTTLSSSNTDVTGVTAQTYTGKPILQSVTVTPKKTRANPDPEPLTEGVDYEVTQATGTDKKTGTYSIIVTGKGKYTGTIKKTFKVNPFDLSKATADQLSADFATGSQQSYVKSGSRPKMKLTFNGKELTEGTDYTLTYKNNTAVNDGSNVKKVPTVTIKGKGNFKGTLTRTFTIVPRSLEGFQNVVGANSSINAADVVTKGKKNTYQSAPVLLDENGKKMTAGTDYEKTYVYKDASGKVLDKNSFPQVGDTITVTVTGRGNYTGTASATYRILAKNKSISSAAVKLVNKQYYTGEKVCPTKDDLTVTIGKTVLGPDDYEIIGYTNNTAKGNASLTIKGVGEYGGTKTVKFAILPQVLKWLLE